MRRASPSPAPAVRTMKSGRALPVAASLSLLAAGCGVFGEDVAATPGSFSACLSETGYPSSTDPDDVDSIARAAGVGAVWADIDGNHVTVVFAGTDAEAERIEAAYAAPGGAATDGSAGAVARDGTVVLRWESPPAKSGAMAVEHCLSTQT